VKRHQRNGGHAGGWRRRGEVNGNGVCNGGRKLKSKNLKSASVALAKMT